ncbi:methionyl-tRNA formyltransferase [bacterium]|nr:MAG: methionyl-tRNA formyltransferase [bacterium]
MIKIVFWGTSKFAENILESLLKNDNFDIVAVVTQTDKPVGRKKEITSPLVKQIAEKKNIPVLQPEKLDNDFENKLKKFRIDTSIDVSIVASYGKIIPESVLSIPVHGSINVHGSLLPQYRGASPIQTAIVNGEKKTGTTLILMDAGMDTGNILKQQSLEISEDDNYETLLKELSELGSEMLNDVLPALITGKIKPVKQNDTEATYTKILKSGDYEINWDKSAEEINSFVRGVYPRAYGMVNIGKEKIRVKILLCSVQDDKNFKIHPPAGGSKKISQPKADPPRAENIKYQIKNGTLFGCEKRLFVVCGENEVLEIKKIQVAGKNVVSGRDFLNGHVIQCTMYNEQ